MPIARVSTSSEARATRVSARTTTAVTSGGSLRQVIPLSVPELGGNEWTYLKECVDSGWVSSVGPFVDRFERAIADYVGAAHGVAVVNGTAALHTALQVLGIGPEDAVLVPDLTFVAPVNAVRYCRAQPILVDVDPRTWHLDVKKLAWFLRTQCIRRSRACYSRRTGKRVRAVMPVHILGLACDMDRIMELAREHHLSVVEDAAEAMGVRYQGRHVGTFGDVGVFSFNGNKVMTSGGGGMLVTDHPRLAERARYLTTQAKDDAIESVHRELGYNYRLTNLQAAVGLAQLERLETFLARKRAIAHTYERLLQQVDGVSLMPAPPEVEPTYWLYTILLEQGTTLTKRQAIVRQLRAHGIEVRPLWHPIHRLPLYRRCERVKLRAATTLYERAISLPSSVGLQPAELQRCVEALQQVLIER